MKCSRCPKELDLDDISLRTGKPFTYCQNCRNSRVLASNEKRQQYMRHYAKDNAEKYKNQWQEIRQKFFDMYGHKCACCSEGFDIFLTLDHIDGQGYLDRQKGGTYGVYKKAISEHRPDLYQVLCYNCNCAKRTGLECPHKTMASFKKEI